MAATSPRRFSLVASLDVGVDDALGLLLALSSPDIELLALVPQFGNTDLSFVHDNVLKLYGVLDRHFEAVPADKERFPGTQSSRKPVLVRGAAGPLEGQGHTAKYFHGSDGLGGITEDHGKSIPLPSASSLSHLLTVPEDLNESGADTTLRLLEAEPDKSVIYVALGPLTDLALLLRKDAELFKRKVALVSIMGGALEIPGNTSPYAEFNFYADASAAHEVMAAASPSFPIHLAPLDITSRHMLPWSVYTSRVDPDFGPFPSTPASSSMLAPLPFFTSAFLSHTKKIMARYGKDGMELHDPLAVWFALEWAAAQAGQAQNGQDGQGSSKMPSAWAIEKREFVVERYGEFTAGMCVVDRRAALPSSERGKSRAELQEQLEATQKRSQTEQSEAPARVQVDDPAQAEIGEAQRAAGQGVNVIIRTPGSEALVETLLKDIWGV